MTGLSWGIAMTCWPAKSWAATMPPVISLAFFSPSSSCRSNSATLAPAAASADAVQQLADRVEGNLLAAAQEIEKLALLSHDGVLDAARMDALVADAARFDVFRLIDSAMNGDAAQVSRMLAGLRAEGEVVPALLGMVVKELQRVAAIARVQARGGNLAAEFKAQQIWESRQAAYRRALPRHSARQWEQFVARIAAVDQAAKGRAAGDPWVLLERLLLAVADSRARALLAS